MLPSRLAALGAFVALIAAAPSAQPAPAAHVGRLDANDPVRESGENYDAYTFEAQANQLVTVRMASEAFDTYLIVRSPSGVETVSDDFDGTDSQVDLVVTEPGTWTAWASSFSEGSSGAYTLVMRPREVGRSRVVEGRLDRRDEQALKGEYVDTHTFETDGRGEVLIGLTSLGFDGYLVITKPDGTVIREDGATPEEMQVGPIPAERGRWRVVVTSAHEGMVGAYDLRFVTFTP